MLTSCFLFIIYIFIYSYVYLLEVNAQCFMEACAVCTCDENELLPFLIKKPKAADTSDDIQLESNHYDKLNQYGWISNNMIAPNELSYLEENSVLSSNSNNWIAIAEQDDHSKGEYVNLLKNPERFTGYSGESARKVWQAIQQENCFGDINDICYEKRVFYRLMSGLQSSISVHIAKEYYYPNRTWGPNFELFYNSVGYHKDRINNLYFTFLFLLRAVIKAKDIFENYPYNIENTTEVTVIKGLLSLLVSTKLNKQSLLQIVTKNSNNINIEGSQIDFLLNSKLDQCRNGFDESVLFQVSKTYGDQNKFWQSKNEKELMMEQFRLKFRNVSKIMDCVTCEKCRLWGKLQILGLGTAIKILLTPEDQQQLLLNRQEFVALINTLHQITKSVEFTSERLRREFMIPPNTNLKNFTMIYILLFFLPLCIVYIVKMMKSK